MEKLLQPPDYDGYSVVASVPLLYVPLDGGLGRQRQDVLDATRFVTVQWTGGRKRFETVRDFYRAYVGRNAEPFLIDLIDADGTLVEHIANFVSFKPIGQQRGIGFVSIAQLEVTPNLENTEWPGNANLLLGLHFDGNLKDETGNGTYVIGPFGTPEPLNFGPGKFDTSALLRTNYNDIIYSNDRGSLVLNKYDEFQIDFWVKPTVGAFGPSGGGVVELIGWGTPNGSALNGTPDSGQFLVRVIGDGSFANLVVTYAFFDTVEGTVKSTNLNIIDEDVPSTMAVDGQYHYVKIAARGNDIFAWIDGLLVLNNTNEEGNRPMWKDTVYVNQRFAVGGLFAGSYTGDYSNFPQGAAWSIPFSGLIEDLRVANGKGSADISSKVPTRPFGKGNVALTLAPDQSGYAVGVGADLVRTQQDGSSGQYSRNLFNSANQVEVTWICDAEEYAYIAQCHRAAVVGGGTTFDIDLLLDETEELTTYSARFVPGTFKLASIKGETYNVGATLEIKPIDYDVVNSPFVVDTGLADRRLPAASGMYTLSGKDVQFKLSHTHFKAQTGYFGIQGSDIPTLKGKFFAAAGGVYTLSGQNATITHEGGGAPSTKELRQDGGYELREDGGYELRD